MKALVTGGTGFVGSHLAEALLGRGVEVRCLVRDPDDLKWLKGLDVELVKGDASDAGSLGGACSGVEYVFHAAGITKAVRPSDYYKVNAEGTKNMAEAAERDASGLKKFVYVSSQAAAGPSVEGRPRKEDDAPAPVTDYGRSKLAGEQYALQYMDRLPIVIVRPPSVYGPRDRDVYSLFKMASRGFRPAFAGARLISVCYVGDLVDGLISAAFGDTESGDAYFVAYPKPYSWDEMGNAVADALGVKVVRVKIPIPALGVVAVFAELFCAVLGKPALLNRQKMAEIKQRYWVLDVTKAKEKLGFEAGCDFRAGAGLTAEWYRRQGWI